MTGNKVLLDTSIVIELFKGDQEVLNFLDNFRFYIYDRLNNKTYAALGNGSSGMMRAFKSAIKKITPGK